MLTLTKIRDAIEKIINEKPEIALYKIEAYACKKDGIQISTVNIFSNSHNVYSALSTNPKNKKLGKDLLYGLFILDLNATRLKNIEIHEAKKTLIIEFYGIEK